MAKKPSRAQVSFSALLEPDVALDPRVVLITDPRWRSCLDELKKPSYLGIDSEGYDDSAQAGGDADTTDDPNYDPDTTRDFDPFQSQIRLIQVALPSGRCMVADLGGVGDDRAARRQLYGDHGDAYTMTIDGVTTTVPIYQPGSFFDLLRDVVESETIPKILHHAKFDALWLRIHFGWRMRCIRCTMLLSQLYWAGLPVRHGLGFLSERAVGAGAPGTWLVSKQLQRSEWRWRLSNAQLNYAATDALVVVPLFKWLGGLIAAEGMLPCALAECGAVAAFVEFEYNGMPVNPAMLDDHIAMWQRGRELALEPFTKRYPGVDPNKTQVVAVALSLDDCYDGFQFYELDELKPRKQPLYILGRRFDYHFLTKPDKYASEDDHSVAEVVLSKFAKLPWISALLDWRSMGVVIKWMQNVRRRVKRDGRVRGEYAQIAGGENRGGNDSVGKGHGRSACIARGSLIQAACDRHQYRDGIPIENIKVGDWVYCFNSNNNLKLRQVKAVWSNGFKPVVRIHWQGTGGRHKGYLDLTSDHEVRLTSGVYCAAQNLKRGDSVAAVHWADWLGYGRLYAAGYPSFIREHRFIHHEITGKTSEAVHHINGKTKDNRPENLEGMTAVEHAKHHGTHISNDLRTLRSENGRIIAERDRDRLLNQLTKAVEQQRLRYTRDEVEEALARNGWSITRTKNDLKHDHGSFLALLRRLGFDIEAIKRHSAELDSLNKRGKGTNKRICAKCGLQGHLQRSCERYYKKLKKQRVCSKCGMTGHYVSTCGNDSRRIWKKKPEIPNNHYIIQIEVLPEPIEVFDMSVDECENFIANEICVHNCRAPSLQQSANPQPKLNKLIHDAMGFSGEIATMSPRIPFAGHDETTASYLLWAAARLRGEVADPFTTKQQDGVGDVLKGVVGPQHGTTAKTQPSESHAIVEGVWDDSEVATWQVEEDAEAEDATTRLRRAAWYEELAAKCLASPRQLTVADFSQAHMRIAAQASQDPQLCEDFNLDRDAHLKLAYDFGVATGQVPRDLPEEAFFAWYDKKHPKHKFVKQVLRQPAKTGNYTCLNLGSVARLKGAGDTAKPPVMLEYEQWEIIRDAWRKRYAVLAQYQRQHIRDCNKHDVVIDGLHYGMAWSLRTGGRLFLRKEVDKFDRGDAEWCNSCRRTHGRLTVKGTDAVAYRWLRTEADAIKWANERILAEFDRHDVYFMARRLHPVGDVWDARLSNMAHDENNQDCRKHYGLAVAKCVRVWFNQGLMWTGVVDIPVEPRDIQDKDLLVRTWADK